MELVPFNPSWADSGSKLDLKGVYRRGDLLAALPIRRHNDHVAKGFQYVTLATVEDVNQVVPYVRGQGIDLTRLQDSYERTAAGPFKATVYAAAQPQRDADEADTLRARLATLDATAKPAKAGK